MADKFVKELETRGIKRAQIGGFDIDGILRGKYVSLDKLRSALAGGFGFCDVIFGWDMADAIYDRSSVTGWERGFPDALAVLDPDTTRDLPWEPGVALVLADFRDDEGGPHPACARSLLKGMRDRAREMGFEATFSCEYEFFFFDETSRTLVDKGFRRLQPLDSGMFGYSVLRTGQHRDLMAAVLDGTSAFDVEIEGLHTETGPGVYEAAIRHDEVLRAADKAALFKLAVKQIAAEHAVSATFMAKCHVDLPGCSGHLHQSLWKNGKNAFFKKNGMSATMRRYLAGLVQLAPEMTALISPTVNSYKRYVPGVWAPLTSSWGVENRTCNVRVIGLDDKKGCRIEFRQSAADINPYVAMAASLGMGLYGIEHDLELPPETEGDATEQGPPLPKSLAEATERLARSEAARAIVGDAFLEHYVHTRRWEVREYAKAVTDWELARYFEAV